MIPRLLPALVAAALLSGCMSVKYSAQGAVDHGARRGAVVHTWQHSLFLGLLPVSSVPIDRYCPDGGVLHVRSSVGPLGALATVATLGVWTPTHVKVVCADWPGDAWASVTPDDPPELSSPPLAVPAETWPAPDGGADTDTLVIETQDGTRVIVTR